MRQARGSHATPRYRSIAIAIAEEIESQGWPAHSKIPSELSLAAQFGVSRGTVTKALDSLVSQGLLYRRKPRGTFVASRPSSATAKISDIAAPSSQHADVIGVIIGGITVEPMDSVHGSIIMGVQTVGRSAGYGIMLALSENDVLMERYFIEHMCARGVGGEILFPGSHPVERRNGVLVSIGDEARISTLKTMQAQSIPFVLVDRLVPAVDCDWVISDDEAAGQTATEHLIKLGHRRIGFMATSPYVTSIANRFAGFVSSLQRHGLEIDDRFIVDHLRESFHDTYPRESREDGARLQSFLCSGERPSGVVTSNDHVALRLVVAAEAAGLRVPHDLAIVSCGWGGKMGAYGRVALTSVVQPLLDVGRQATHILLDRMAGRSSKIRQLTLPVSLAVRESCGAGERASALAARPPA